MAALCCTKKLISRSWSQCLICGYGSMSNHVHLKHPMPFLSSTINRKNIGLKQNNQRSEVREIGIIFTREPLVKVAVIQTCLRKEWGYTVKWQSLWRWNDDKDTDKSLDFEAMTWFTDRYTLVISLSRWLAYHSHRHFQWQSAWLPETTWGSSSSDTCKCVIIVFGVIS